MFGGSGVGMAIEISTAFILTTTNMVAWGGSDAGYVFSFAKHKFGIFGCETPILAVKGTIVDL